MSTALTFPLHYVLLTAGRHHLEQHLHLSSVHILRSPVSQSLVQVRRNTQLDTLAHSTPLTSIASSDPITPLDCVPFTPYITQLPVSASTTHLLVSLAAEPHLHQTRRIHCIVKCLVLGVAS